MESYWFIESAQFYQYCALLYNGEQVTAVSAEELNDIRCNADRWSKPGFASENLKIINGEAHIDISGVLLQSASEIDELLAVVFGNSYTTYAGIEAQISEAEADDEVHTIVFNVDSPGGVMAGVDGAAMRIANASKPTEARVNWIAASAAYYLASQAGSIKATSPLASVGSIGVVNSLTDVTERNAKSGIKKYSLTSTNAPNKRLEPHSEEFKAQIIERLDSLHNIFAQRVAEGRTRATGRDFTIASVNADFGKGGMVIASDALESGMIDVIEESRGESPIIKEAPMVDDKKTTEVASIDAATETGVQTERARVAALLPWMSADSKRVISAINEGETLSPALMAELSTKVAEQAQADALLAVEANEAERIAKAAESLEEDKAPELSGLEAGKDEEVKSEENAMYEAALASSKIKGKESK